MMTHVRRIFEGLAFGATFCALLFAVSAPLEATTLARMSIEQMVVTAKLIVRARCIENFARWDAGEIWTFTSFEVEETWRGSASSRVTVRLLGGRSGDLTSSVSGVPRFRPGEEVVLFLEPTGRGDFSVVSWEQGTFRVQSDAATGQQTVTQDTASFETFNPATHKFEATGVRHLSLAEFHARVEAAVQSENGGRP